jgi:hypothetical protein
MSANNYLEQLFELYADIIYQLAVTLLGRIPRTQML